MSTALVTGGTRGIGFAVAKALLERGHSVVVTGTTDDGILRAEHALAAATGDATRVMGVGCDVRDRAAVHRAVEAAVAALRRPRRAGQQRRRRRRPRRSPTWRTRNGRGSSTPTSPASSTAARPRSRTSNARRRLDRQHQQPGGEEPVRRRRRLLRHQGRPRRLQRGADAGAALRRHPRRARLPRLGRHRVQRPRARRRRRLEAAPRRRRAGRSPTCSRIPAAACRAASRSGRRSRPGSDLRDDRIGLRAALPEERLRPRLRAHARGGLHRSRATRSRSCWPTSPANGSRRGHPAHPRPRRSRVGRRRRQAALERADLAASRRHAGSTSTPSQQGAMFGYQLEQPPPVDRYYDGRGPLAFGDYDVFVHHTPGHCPGNVCLQVGRRGERRHGSVRRRHAVRRLDRPHRPARAATTRR